MTKESDWQAESELALDCIRSYPAGIAQSDLWREINLDSRECSRILKRLEDEGLIERTELKKDGIRTYLVKPAHKSVKSTDLSLLMAGDAIIPCVACDEECEATKCPMLEDWIYELVFSEMD